MFIDSWIMSCRVLKRGMEDFTLNTIIGLAKAHNFKKVVGEYIPTKKNGIVKDHYAGLGFAPAGDRWVMDVAKYQERVSFITAKK